MESADDEKKSFPIFHQVSPFADADDKSQDQREYRLDFNEYAIDISSPSKNGVEESRGSAGRSVPTTGSPENKSYVSTWTKFVDAASGYAYYVNDATGESKWGDPEPAVASNVQSATPSKKSAPYSSGDNEWVEYTDPGSGYTFYFNEVGHCG
jgi:hypothetical protein